MIKSNFGNVKRKVSIACCLALFTVQVCLAVNNPFSYNTGINDCDVIKYNGEYFIQGNWLKGDMLRSRNLESWGERTHVFSWSNSWHTAVNQTDPDYDIHGTHIRYDNGIFHLYAHLDVTDGITHATSNNIWGPYTEPVDSPFAIHIDSDTFKDEDGSLYFYMTKFSGGNGNYVRTMSDLWTQSSDYIKQISTTVGSGDWEDATHINEGPKVFRYRDRYYMLYNAFPTDNPDYAVGCVESPGPTSFSNSGKYSSPVCSRSTPAGTTDEIAYIGQPWMVDGINGFEKWFGYFGQTTSEGRTQRIDRMHFFDRRLYIDGPTNRYSTGYHPGPAKPQLRSLFCLADGSMPVEDWTVLGSGTWGIANEQAYQSDQGTWSFNVINRDPATSYLFEANLRFTEAVDTEDKAGVVAYYKDMDNYVLVGFDRGTNGSHDNWYMHVRENAVDAVYSGNYNNTVDYSVYHKIRVVKNGSDFDLLIDDVIPPNFATVVTGFSDAAIPGIFTDHAAAVFDGIIYTVGWDEYDAGVTGWTDNVNGMVTAGNWSYASNGITQSLESGFNYIFKGDLMPQYEISTQVTKAGTANGSMGILAVAIDGNNYIGAEIDLTTNELFTYGLNNAVPLAEQRVSVPAAVTYNLRAVKLSDRVIIFVDGQELITVNETFGPSQVGLINQNMAARYNGILTYQFEPKTTQRWLNTDVGNVGFAGSADYNEGTFTLTGSGSDIWHLNDEFQYLYRTWSGDGEIVTRVVSVEESDWWAKGAIMFRDSLAGDSGMVMLCATPGAGNAQLIWRDGPGYGTGVLEHTGLSFPMWLKLKRVGSTFTGYRSTDGQNWIQIGTCSPPLNSVGKIGLGITAHSNTRIGNAVFDNIASPHGSLGVPAPWQTSDIGDVGYSGNADTQNSTFIIEGGGSGIDEVADQFRYVYESLNAEGRITARVVALDGADSDAKAGIMIRNDLTAGSSNHMLSVNADGDLQLTLRQSPNTGTGTYTVPGGPFTGPLWLRLQRVSWLGCRLAFYYSTDGTNWTEILPPNNWELNCIGLSAYAGLAVTSGNNDKVAGAVFDNVSVLDCTISSQQGDIDGDCIVGFSDLQIISQQWLSSGGQPSADIYVDNIINNLDFVSMAQRWLECGWVPDTDCP